MADNETVLINALAEIATHAMTEETEKIVAELPDELYAEVAKTIEALTAE